MERSGFRRFPVTFLIPLLFLFLSTCALSCGRDRDEAPQEYPGVEDLEGSDISKVELVPVRVASPTVGDISSFIQSSTTVEAEKEVDVYSKAVGICKSLYVEEGDYVHSGDLLALLEDEEVRIAVEQAALRFKRASEDYERAVQMAAEDLISTKALEDAKFARKLTQAEMQLAERRLANTRIKAPINGVITERKVKSGDLVNATSKLFKVVDLRSLSAVVHIPEKEAGFVKMDQGVTVLADSLPDRTYTGKVKRISPVVDPNSGTVKVTIGLSDTEDLKPGLFIRTRIVTDTHKKALLIPKIAVILEGDAQKVFVIKDGIAQEVFIRAGYSDIEKVEVLEGIGPDDLLVVLGHLGLKDGARVRIVD